MGYETQMIIVEKYSTMKQFNCMIDDKLYHCFHKDSKDPSSPLIYYPDGDTETPVPSNAIIKEGDWCRVIATFDLSKAGSFPGLSPFKDSDGSYAYDPFDGNLVLGTDPYGDYRSFVPIDQAIEHIKKAIKEETRINLVPYRRLTIALSFLEAIKKEYLPHEGFTQIGCLFWGH